MEDVHTKFHRQVRSAVAAQRSCSTGDFASSCREAARIKQVWMAPPHEEERRAKASQVFGFDFARTGFMATRWPSRAEPDRHPPLMPFPLEPESRGGDVCSRFDHCAGTGRSDCGGSPDITSRTLEDQLAYLLGLAKKMDHVVLAGAADGASPWIVKLAIAFMYANRDILRWVICCMTGSDADYNYLEDTIFRWAYLRDSEQLFYLADETDFDGMCAGGMDSAPPRAVNYLIGSTQFVLICRMNPLWHHVHATYGRTYKRSPELCLLAMLGVTLVHEVLHYAYAHDDYTAYASDELKAKCDVQHRIDSSVLWALAQRYPEIPASRCCWVDARPHADVVTWDTLWNFYGVAVKVDEGRCGS